MSEIYTIGYSVFDTKKFVEVLKSYGITCLIDVRSIPLSTYYKDFDKENISKFLNDNGIIYRHYEKEFGAHQTDEKFFTDGVLDFEKFSKSSQFIDGVKKVEAGMKLGYKFVLMCAEKRPEVCHRNILVARAFYERGHEVRNILDNGCYITQDKIEKILLNKYFPHRNQILLFDNLDTAEMIRQSYAKQNFEIGYRLNDDVDEKNFHDRIYQEDGERFF